MTVKEDYSFEPVGSVDPSAPIMVGAVDEVEIDIEELPSDTAIMVGCGLLGWVVAGPCLAIVTALGGKYIADRHEGPLAESSKAVGRIAAVAGRKAKEEKLLDKIKAAISSLFSGRKDCKNCGAPISIRSKVSLASSECNVMYCCCIK
eukprot:15604_1